MPEKFGPDTDIQKWVKFFNEYNLPWQYTPRSVMVHPRGGENLVCDDSLSLEAKASENFDGYTGFEFIAYFDESGKFKKAGVWE